MTTDPFDLQAFQSALDQLMNASDMEEMAEITAENPILLSDEADATFDVLIKAQEDETVAQSLGQLREMLKMIRQALAGENEPSGIQGGDSGTA